MLRLEKIIYLLVLSLFVTFCKGPVQQGESKIKGQWSVINPKIEANLLIREDSTFHIDILTTSGIEAEGVANIDLNNRITFINTMGTDSVASNPTPGIYNYKIISDTLRFTLIKDSVSRRQLLLSDPWVRK